MMWTNEQVNKYCFREIVQHKSLLSLSHKLTRLIYFTLKSLPLTFLEGIMLVTERKPYMWCFKCCRPAITQPRICSACVDGYIKTCFWILTVRTLRDGKVHLNGKMDLYSLTRFNLEITNGKNKHFQKVLEFINTGPNEGGVYKAVIVIRTYKCCHVWKIV